MIRYLKKGDAYLMEKMLPNGMYFYIQIIDGKISSKMQTKRVASDVTEISKVEFIEIVNNLDDKTREVFNVILSKL